MGELKVLDLFCGSGGLSMGAEQAGMEVVAGVDRDPSALQTYARNSLEDFDTFKPSESYTSDLPCMMEFLYFTSLRKV